MHFLTLFTKRLIIIIKYLFKGEGKMATKLNGYEIFGIILIIISAIFLLIGNLIEGLWPITEKIFESSIIAIIGLIGIISLAEGRKMKRRTK